MLTWMRQKYMSFTIMEFMPATWDRLFYEIKNKMLGLNSLFCMTTGQLKIWALGFTWRLS